MGKKKTKRIDNSPLSIQVKSFGEKEYRRRGNIDKVTREFLEYMVNVYSFDLKKFQEFLHGKSKKKKTETIPEGSEK